MIELERQMTKADVMEVSDAVAGLTAAIKAQPAYRTLRAAHEALQADEEAQKLLEDLQARQRRLQVVADDASAADFQERLEHFYNLPVVAAYHEAEDALVELLKEIDDVISTAAGIDFAEHARRSSCCGG